MHTASSSVCYTSASSFNRMYSSIRFPFNDLGYVKKAHSTWGSSWNELLKVLSAFILRIFLLYCKNIHKIDLHHQKFSIQILFGLLVVLYDLAIGAVNPHKLVFRILIAPIWVIR